jgi:hypothetical protein
VAVHLLDAKRYVAYSRRRNEYAKPARYNEQELGYEPMMAIVDSLLNEGWCEQIIGDVTPNPKDRKSTRIRPAEKMIELIHRSRIALEAIGRHPKEELVILRDYKVAGDKKGKDIDYHPETEFTLKARARLRAFNGMLQRHKIDPPPLDVEIDPLYGYVRRIFANRSFDEGGRFYGGWWQSLNEDQRANIRLDGIAVCELDYRGVHLYLTYRQKGLVYRDDPYELASLPKDARPIAKAALLILFNVKKKESAAKGIAAVVAATKNAIKDAITDAGGLNRKAVNRFSGVEDIDSYLKGDRLKEIVEQMIEKHPNVADRFFTGSGNRLQRNDSDLADYVIGRFVELDKPILPIHDSFVVKEEDKAFLKTTMEDACKEVLDFYPCEIKHALSWFG